VDRVDVKQRSYAIQSRLYLLKLAFLALREARSRGMVAHSPCAVGAGRDHSRNPLSNIQSAVIRE